MDIPTYVKIIDSKALCICIVLIFGCFALGNAQTTLDSLLKVSQKQQKDVLVATLNEISWEYKNSKPDSALYYAKKALKISESFNYSNGVASSYNSMAGVFESQGKLDSAKAYHFKSLKIKETNQDSVGIADSYNNLGIVYDQMANYSVALTYYFKALKLYEQHQTSFDKVPMVLGNIGIVYKKQKEFKKTLKYYERALSIYEENNYEVGIVITKGNIGALQLKLEDYESAITYTTEAKDDYERLGYTRYVPYPIFNRAIAKDSLKRHEDAKLDFELAIRKFEETNNPYELSHANIGLAHNQLFRNKPEEALQTLNKALLIAKENGFKEFEVKAYQGLARVNAQLKNYKNAYDFQELYRKANDSLFEVEKTKTIFELETRYETQKNENIILQQRADLAEKDLEARQKNTFIFGSLSLAVVFGLLGYLFYKQQKLRNRQLKKESELQTALARIETQNKLQEQRLRISRDLHDNIGSQLTFVTSSVDNLKYALDGSNEKVTTKLGDISNFTTQTIYELRDTIWAMNKNTIKAEDLQVRIANFMENAGKSHDQVTFKFNAADSISEVIFTSIQGMNLYRIIQEAVNNALKYANASLISVKIEAIDSPQEFSEATANPKMQLTIKDNGLGFNEATIEAGNGLANMRKRARDLGGSATITATLNEGTTVKVVF